MLNISFTSYVCSELKKIHPTRILDIGKRHETDGFFLSESLHMPNQLYTFDSLYSQEIKEKIEGLPLYDVVLGIDVLSDFNKEEGHTIIRHLLAHTKEYILLSVPLHPAGNQYEWNIKDFQDYDFVYYQIGDKNNTVQVMKIFPMKQHPKKEIDTILLQEVEIIKETPLDITFILPHRRITGGLKSILLQMEALQKKGHHVHAVLRSDIEKKALPDFYPIRVSSSKVIPDNMPFQKYFKNRKTDIIVASFLTQLEELSFCKQPVLYWEQGSEWLFGDIKENTQEDGIRILLERAFQSDVHILSVSPFVQSILANKYNRDTYVLPNFIDTNFFVPGKKEKDIFTITLVGSPKTTFKGFDIALHALTKLHNLGFVFHVDWIIQHNIRVQDLPFSLTYHYAPSHEAIRDLYQQSDVLLWSSWYEGFGMPPLEAMACGIPVVSTKCGGVECFARHGENALLVDVGDVSGLTTGIIMLMKKPELKCSLGKNARQIAELLHYDQGIEELEDLLYKIKNKKTK